MTDDTDASTLGQPSGGERFGMIQVSIYRDPTLSLQAKAVYGLLATYADAGRKSWPGRDRIAAELSTSLRTVARALRELQEAGVIDTRHTQTSNRYQLHDLAVGGYIPGSGPLGHTGTPDGPDGHAGQASEAQEIDQRTRPVIKTISTSSDASCGADSPPSEARPNSVQTTLKGKIDLWIPENYPDMTDGKAMNQLIRSAYGALKRVGYVPAPDMRSRLTAGLRNTLDRGYSLEALYDLTVTSLEQIGGDGMWGDLAYPIETEERRAS